MATVKLKGPGLNCWFAEMLVKDHGPEGARERCTGPMLKAVEAVIAEQQRTVSQEAAEQKGGEHADQA
jgi:hypothetical protein